MTNHVIQLENLVFEAVVENLLVSKYCIDYRKDPQRWHRTGCYGYPASILLFSIADTIGGYILGGNVRNHFNILNHVDYYHLNLSVDEINEIYRNYRSRLTHNSALAIGRLMDIGTRNDPIYEHLDNRNIKLNLLPFWNKTYYCVETFISLTNLSGNLLANEILSIPSPN